VAEWVDDSTEAPAVLLSHGGYWGSACAYRLFEKYIGVINNQQYPAGRTLDGLRTESFPLPTGRCDPKRGTSNRKLGDDVVSLANTVQDSGAKRSLVERNGCTGAIKPQLRLDLGHRHYRSADRVAQSSG
jgi:hypothetical protein